MLVSLLFFDDSSSGAGFGVTINFFAAVDFFVVIAFSSENGSEIKSLQWKYVLCSFFLINAKNMYNIYGRNGSLNLKSFTNESFFNVTL